MRPLSIILGLLVAIGPTILGQTRIGVMPVRGNVYLIYGAGPNIAMQVGEQAVVLVDSGRAEISDQIRAAIRTITPKPIIAIFNTGADAERISGNENLAMGGFFLLESANQSRPQASVIAHLGVLERVTANNSGLAQGAAPTDTYDTSDWKFYINDEPVILEHIPAAHSDSDSIVFFRRSDVVVTGDIFDLTGYPVIDTQHGGTLQGILDGLNHILKDITVAKENEQGGTMIVPGHGRICDRNDLANYRDMLTIIRDRIADLVKKGRTLDQVRAAKPTYDYDGGYGVDRGSWTTNMFVEAVYRELSKKGSK
jgi:glyoxylase-like metal-dependent hydrolase (beta-lactamase superfamily II)